VQRSASLHGERGQSSDLFFFFSYSLTFSACGSLQEHAAPQHVVIADQFIDRTRTRADTFFGDGLIGHVALGEPVCPKFRALVNDALLSINDHPVIHNGGTYVVIEGPAFSTKAESLMCANPFFSSLSSSTGQGTVNGAVL
jgi:purine nucleoside phosphorylase